MHRVTETRILSAGDVAATNYVGRAYNPHVGNFEDITDGQMSNGKDIIKLRAVNVDFVNSAGLLFSGVMAELLAMIDPKHPELLQPLLIGIQAGSRRISWMGSFDCYGVCWRMWFPGTRLSAGDLVDFSVTEDWR